MISEMFINGLSCWIQDVKRMYFPISFSEHRDTVQINPIDIYSVVKSSKPIL